MHTAYLTPQERNVLSLFAQHSKETSTPGRLSFYKIAGISVEELHAAADVLIGLIEKGLVETEDTYVFQLTSKGMQVVSDLQKADSIHP